MPEDVLKHIYEGSIVGVATGTPGIFHLNIYQKKLHYEGVPTLL